jgi:hypothetical protein
MMSMRAGGMGVGVARCSNWWRIGPHHGRRKSACLSFFMCHLLFTFVMVPGVLLLVVEVILQRASCTYLVQLLKVVHDVLYLWHSTFLVALYSVS